MIQHLFSIEAKGDKMKTENITASQAAALKSAIEVTPMQRSQQGAGSSTISSCSPLSPLKAIANIFLLDI